jgi:hypothetical protein
VQPQRRSELLALLRETPRRVDGLVRGRSRAVLGWMPAPGKWSILEILSHLRDYELEPGLAVYRMAAEFRPATREVEGEGDAPQNAVREVGHRVHAAGAATARTHGSLEANRVWKRLRRETVALLEAMDPGAWDQAGADPASGPATLADHVEQHVQHDRTHLAQIEANLERRSIFDRFDAARREVRAHAENLEAAGCAQTAGLDELARLRDFEHGMLLRYVRILERDRPPLEPLASDPPGSREAPPAGIWREFDGLRAATLEFLHAIGPRLWDRRGVHPHRGDLSIAELVGQHLDHDASRLTALRQLVGVSASARPAWRRR